VLNSAARDLHCKPSLVHRILPAVIRRVRYVHARVWWPWVSFGRGCDVRSGLYLYLAPGAKASFGPACVIDRGMSVEVFGELSVGSRTIFGHHCTLASRSLVTIGEDCLIAELVSIRDHDHCFDRLDIPTREQGMKIAPVSIGNNVWIGAKVTIAKGVTIGDNAIIGANAVVTHDIPANAIAMGIPARVSRLRT
jgi:acetyltransferase-like isoleucine patch superfamily enzyme